MTILSGTKLNGESRPEGRRAGIARSKITQDVRDYTKEQGVQVEVALTEGMKKKAEEFKEKGSEIYQEV